MNLNLSDEEKETNEIVKMLEFYLRDIAESEIFQLSQSLFPIKKTSDPYAALFGSLLTSYMININKSKNFEEITSEVVKKISHFTTDFQDKIKRMLSQGDFYLKFKSKVLKNKQEIFKLVITPTITKQALKQSTVKDSFKEAAKDTEEQISVVESKNTGENKNKRVKGNQKQISQTKNSTSNGQKSHKGGLSKKSGPITELSSQIDVSIDLTDRSMCLCRKTLSMQNNETGVFTCIHCKNIFHNECMKKKENTRHCSLCHLTKIIPYKQIKKVLFLGLLKKGRRKHEITFFLSEKEINSHTRIEVRSFRLKQNTQTALLFPDAATININEHLIKEYQPLHRQSSLKYRKDDVLHINPRVSALQKQNKVIITERGPSKQLRDERIQIENHLIGFFIVEQKKIDVLVKEISIHSITSFEESKQILEAGFRQCDEIVCEVVKIPLTCTLSTQRIKFPGRGILCNHYQCFDLNNYLVMTSSSSNPRWVCPLCKLPSYEFRIDCILIAILQQYSQFAVTEVMFFKTGEFTVHADEVLIKDKVSNIYDLDIENKGKRMMEALQSPEQLKKRKSPEQFIRQRVISLDD